MNVSRRNILQLVGGSVLLGGCDLTLFNPCVSAPLPDDLARHPVVTASWAGVDPARMWDGHVHIAGMGDDPTSGIWIHPGMTAPWSLRRYVTMKFLLDASCADPARVDASYVERMLGWMAGFPAGAKLVLLAFDHFYDPEGRRIPEQGAFHIPDAYAARLANEHPERFEWIASVHPYRQDVEEALAWAAQHGARGVKWLPQSMGMDPGSPRCDRAYRAMARLGLPLLAHVGRENTVPAGGLEAWANPLLLRRALDAGVTVVAAHCASDGEARDLDQGENGPMVSAFDLFLRLLGEEGYKGRLYGDISATVLTNRPERIIRTLLEHGEWHERLLYGSDHPLPGLMPALDVGKLERSGLVTVEVGEVLRRVRAHNPLLFHFLLMRQVESGGKRFSAEVFDTRRVWGKDSA